MFQQGEFADRRKLRQPDRLTKRTNCCGSVAAPANPTNGGHTGIVPSRYKALFYKRKQLALTQNRVSQIKPSKLPLIRLCGQPLDMIDEPFVKRTVMLKLQRAQTVRNLFQRIAQRVRIIVHRINTPRVCSAVMVRLQNPVNDGVAQIHVGRGHINFRT